MLLIFAAVWAATKPHYRQFPWSQNKTT